jgi:hypothetical protein
MASLMPRIEMTSLEDDETVLLPFGGGGGAGGYDDTYSVGKGSTASSYESRLDDHSDAIAPKNRHRTAVQWSYRLWH